MKFRKILAHLVKDSLKQQEENTVMRARLSARAWLNEHCTITLGTYRQAGHSTASMYLGNTYRVMQLAPSFKMATYLKTFPLYHRLYDKLFISNVTSSSLEDEDTFKYFLETKDVLIIDGVSLVKPARLDEIKTWCAPHAHTHLFTLVLLQ